MIKGPLYGLAFLAVLVVFLVTPLLAQEEVRRLHEQFPAEGLERVRVDNYKGAIHIEQWDKDEIDVQVEIRPDRSDRSSVGLVDEVEISMRRFGKTLVVETNNEPAQTSVREGWFSWNSVSLPLVNYHIRLPAGLEMGIDDYKSEIRIDSYSGKLTLDTYKGRTEISAFKGDVLLDTHKGGVKIHGLEGYLSLETHKGEVTVADFRGQADIETYKGEIEIDFIALTGDSRFATHKGELFITLPTEANTRVEARMGKRGRLNFRSQKYSGGRDDFYENDYNLTLGNGKDYRITIRNEHGRITLR